MAGTIGSLFHCNTLLTHRSSNICCASHHSRREFARQVSFTRASGSVAADVTKNQSLSLKKSPWLTLPLKDPMVNRFYSLEENQVIPIIKQYTTSEHENENEMDMDDDPFCLGSSHGWLVYTNCSDCALFLYNPISHGIIKLPSIYTLRDDKPYYPYAFINTLILSSSPDEEGCIAMCIYGPMYKLGFCRPGHDTAWIPLDENIMGYQQIAYSSKDQLFYAFTHHWDLICWDLRHPSSPKMRKHIEELEREEDSRPLPAEFYNESGFKYGCFRVPYLIVEPWSDDLLIIERFVAYPGAPKDQTNRTDYYKTVYFEVYKVDLNNEEVKYLEHSSNSRIFFVGMQSFSLPAQDYFSQHLRPNSIYFTRYSHTWLSLKDSLYRDPDVGIFNYEDKVFEPCNYACHLKSIKPIMSAPVWFIPNPC